LRFRFLSSPQQIHPDNDSRIERLTLVENVLFEREGSIGCKATEKTTDLNVDTMIFAIGDVADPALGLPYNRDSYITNPDAADPRRAAYELFDPQNGKVLEGMYAVGWARKASDGLVGIARHDGEVGAAHVLKYLETARESSHACADQVRERLEQKGLRVIDKADLELLARAEEKIAREQGLACFKFDNDQAMLQAIESEKAKGVTA
jgi:ferredoxin--NADP+ reductase